MNLKKIESELSQNLSEFNFSLFFSTEVKGREKRKNQIEFKNLLNQAKKKLKKKLPPSDFKRYFAKADKLLEDIDIWFGQHKKGGIVYFNDKYLKVLDVPLDFFDEVYMGDEFITWPLHEVVNLNGSFKILVLNEKNIQAMECDSQGFKIIDNDLFHKSAQEAQKLERVEHFNGHVSRSASSAQSGMSYNGNQGNKSKEWRDLYLKAVDEVLMKSGTNMPIILTGAPQLVKAFKAISRNKSIIDGLEMHSSYKDRSPAEFYREAEKIYYDWKKRKVKQDFVNAMSKKPTERVNEPMKIMRNIKKGRIKEIFVPSFYLLNHKKQAPVSFIKKSLQHLVDLAVSGGVKVKFVDINAMPQKKRIIGTYRW